MDLCTQSGVGLSVKAVLFVSGSIGGDLSEMKMGWIYAHKVGLVCLLKLLVETIHSVHLFLVIKGALVQTKCGLYLHK